MSNVLNFTQPQKEELDLSNDPIYQELLKRPLPIQLLTQDVQSHMGSDFPQQIDRETFEKYCLMTIDRNEPTGRMLSVLVNNFMKAYSDPETVERAMEAFDYLTYLGLDDKRDYEDN